jgi:hypothetical protein
MLAWQNTIGLYEWTFDISSEDEPDVSDEDALSSYVRESLLKIQASHIKTIFKKNNPVLPKNNNNRNNRKKNEKNSKIF